MSAFYRTGFSHIKPLRSASIASHLETTTLSTDYRKFMILHKERKKGQRRREGWVQRNRKKTKTKQTKNTQGQGQSCCYALMADNPKFHFKTEEDKAIVLCQWFISRMGLIHIFYRYRYIDLYSMFQENTSQIKAKIHLVPVSLRAYPSQPTEGPVLIPSVSWVC